MRVKLALGSTASRSTPAARRPGQCRRIEGRDQV